MAPRGRSSGHSRGPVCTPLEMHVPVNYRIVGRPDWLQSAWEPGAWDQNQVIQVTSTGDLAPIKEFLDRIRIHGIDTETTGRTVKGDKGYSMNPVNPDTRMVLFQIGNEDQVYLIDPDLVVEFKPWLESDKFLHLLHNAIYDFKWLLVKYGVHMQRVYCSMLAEQILVAGLLAMKVGLADCVRRHEPFWLINKAVRDMFIGLDDERRKLTRSMAYYSARDIVLMFPLMQDQSKLLKQWQLLDTARDEFDVIFPTAEMEIHGVNLSVPIMRQIIEYWTQHESDLGEKIFKLFTAMKKQQGSLVGSLIPGLDSVFNLKSNAEKLAALREIDINLDDIRRDTLKDVTKNKVKGKDFSPEQREMCKLMAEFSNVTKMTSTYGTNMVDKINQHTGKWHPRFKQLGSGEEEGRKSGGEDKATIATGRFSSDAQQFPKPKELYAPVRRPEEIEHVMSAFGAQIAAMRAERLAVESQQLKEAA